MEKSSCHQNVINNDFYESLGENWYTASDHPIALLRAENALRNPWVIYEVRKRYAGKVEILDVGCGAGFLTNTLAQEGFQVTGIDLSQASLDVAKKHDRSGKVTYLKANAYSLPFEENSFDVVCAMDILEHVENPSQLLHEAARVLRSGGLFFFHTFNRNPLSYVIIIKGVDWFVQNAPKNMHVYNLFIKPDELKSLCSSEQLEIEHMQGFVPNVWSWPFWKMLCTRKIPSDYSFSFTKSLSTGYCGYARKICN